MGFAPWSRDGEEIGFGPIGGAVEVLDRQFGTDPSKRRSVSKRRSATIGKAIPLFSTAEGLVVVTVLVGLLRTFDLCVAGLHKSSLAA